MKQFIFVVVLVVASFSVRAGHPFEKVRPPFGLSWGLSKVELERMGVSLTRCKSFSKSDSVSVCIAGNLPKNFSDTGKVTVVFAPRMGLQKVHVVSTTILPDSHERTQDGEKLELITVMYDVIPSVLGSLGVESENLSQHLLYGGCSMSERVWFFGSARGEKNGAIVMGLKELNYSQSYLTISFESPKWKPVFEKTLQRLVEDIVEP